MKKILIGIPVLNNLEMTRACLLHMLRNTATDRLGLEVEFLIIDNGSIDDIAGMLRADFASSRFPIHYRKNPRNLGVAIAWNQILRFWPQLVPDAGFAYDYYVISNNDALPGPDWLQPMVEALADNERAGWVSTLENGSPVLAELLEAHRLSKEYRVDPGKPFTTAAINASVASIYAKWGGHDAFCQLVRESNLANFLPFRQEARSAVCFMVKSAMVAQIGFFDEDYWPTGIAEDLEYFLRMEQIITPEWLNRERYPAEHKWQAGFCGKSVVHHNWCSTHQGVNFDGRKWDKDREAHWQKKFGKSKQYFTNLFPGDAGVATQPADRKRGRSLFSFRR